MNVQVKKGMKLPIVIKVAQGVSEDSNRKNALHEKRLDNLEQKLNQQYKRFTNNETYVKEIDKLNKSFMGKFKEVIDSNKSTVDKLSNDLTKSFKKQIESKINGIDIEDNSPELKEIKSKISDLEKAIRKISTGKSKEVRTVYNSNKLDSSFDKYYARMEQLIKSVRPILTPSPS